MGRETVRGTSSYQDAALEAYELERALGATDAHATVKSIEAAVQWAYMDFLMNMRNALLETAEDIDDSDSDLVTDGPASLIFAAKSIDDTLPLELRLEWE